jgi:hypothetical protein
MSNVNAEIKMQGNDDAWFTANASVVFADNIQIFHNDGRYKFTDGVTALSALPFRGAGSSYTLTTSEIGSVINGATSATPNDTDLVMSVDTSVAKKNTWTQIKTFLNTYFETLFVKKGTLTNNTILKGSGTDTATNSTIVDDGADVSFIGNGTSPIVNWVSNGTTHAGEITANSTNNRWIFESKNGFDIMQINGTTYVYYSGTNIRLATNNTDVLEITSAQKVNLPLLTASQIVETDASKNLVSVSKATGYNLALGTTAGTVLEGNGAPAETVNTIGALINGSTAATPNDTDLFSVSNASVLKKLSGTNLKAYLKTYFDTIYTTTSAVATQITTALSGYLTSATAASTYLTIANNLSDLSNAITARNNLKHWDFYMTGGNVTTTSNVASDITGFVTPTLDINKRYRMFGTIHTGCNNTGGIRIQVTVPTGCTFSGYLQGTINPTSGTQYSLDLSTNATLSIFAFNAVSSQLGHIIFFIDIQMSTTAGVIQFGFASGTNTQTSTIYQLGTFGEIEQLN